MQLGLPMPFDLRQFSLLDMIRLSAGLFRACSDAHTGEQAARAIAIDLYRSFATDDNKTQCALVRFYQTHAFKDLPPDLQEFVRKRVSTAAAPDLRVLTLLGTAGDEPAWNDRHQSRDHKAIPLPSVEMVEQAPMIAQLIRELGFDIADVIRPPISLLTDTAGKSYNIFHVERAQGSPFIPAQDDFVLRYGVESVIGFGGLLTTGELFAVVLFSKFRVPPDSATRFKKIAIDVKSIFFQLMDKPGFDTQPATPPGVRNTQSQRDRVSKTLDSSLPKLVPGATAPA